MTSDSIRALLRSLIEPTVPLPEQEQRRIRLLSWLLLALLFLTSFGLVWALAFYPAGNTLHVLYGVFIPGLFIMLLIAYRLNRRGHHTASAWLTVAAATLAPWGSVALNRSIVSNNIVPLIYMVLPVFLCSILLSAGATTLVAGIQIIALLIILVVQPATITADWPSLMSFFLVMFVISLVAASLMRQDVSQIERQSRLLVESEARLREQSVRDALTTLFNRRYLDETLERELRRAERAQQPLALIMLDIDHFKRFNDSYGHAAGDALLHDLGVRLRASLRVSDIACRYGGEEFILLLPEATREAAAGRADAIRDSARHLRVGLDGAHPAEPITLSVGVAAFPLDGVTSAALLKSADDALYRAKRAGRDRVAVADGGGYAG